MKTTATIAVILALSASSLALAQSAENHAAMPGMQQDDVKNAEAGPKVQEAIQAPHAAVAVVRAVNPATGNVTLAHEAIRSLHWPAMTMGFAVTDKKLFDKLVVGKTVHVELTKQGSAYVVTAVK